MLNAGIFVTVASDRDVQTYQVRTDKVQKAIEAVARHNSGNVIAWGLVSESYWNRSGFITL